MMAVCIPAPAREMASGFPACPDPMMMASYGCAVVISARLGVKAWRVRASLSPGNDEQAQTDGEQVFGNGDDNVGNAKGAD